jgi:FkbM family methyltransferase
VKEVDFMIDHLREGDTMLDIGANVGVYSLAAGRKVGPSGKVHAFEPNPEVATYLCRTVADNRLSDRITVHRCGLSDHDQSGRLHRADDRTNLGASYVSDNAGDILGAPIELRKLDSVEVSGRVTFIKMDVEGFEVKVLMGGTSLISEDRPIALAELYPKALQEVGASSSVEYISTWERLGYEVAEFQHGVQGRTITSENVSEYERIIDPINILCLPSR